MQYLTFLKKKPPNKEIQHPWQSQIQARPVKRSQIYHLKIKRWASLLIERQGLNYNTHGKASEVHYTRQNKPGLEMN